MSVETYNRLIAEVARRLARTHEHMRGDHREVLPLGMPRDRELTALELEDLAWRAVALTRVTRQSLKRCRPELLISAWEWRMSPEQEAWMLTAEHPASR